MFKLVRAAIALQEPARLVEYKLSYLVSQNMHDIEQIEQIQRRFTKRRPGLKVYSYADRLSKLNVLSLELRRLHTDLIMCYKIVYSLVDVKFDDFFHLSTIATTRGHPFKLFKE